VCDMEYRTKAAQMMVRSGAALMNGSKGNDDG
jgi:hypothetical protein